MIGIYSDSGGETTMDNKLDIQVFFGYISPCGTFKYLFVHLFLAALGLRCCMGFSLVALSGGYSLVPVLRLLIVVASFVAEHRL